MFLSTWLVHVMIALDGTTQLGVSNDDEVLHHRQAQPEDAAPRRPAPCQLEDEPRRVASRQGPHGLKDSGIGKWWQALLAQPAASQSDQRNDDNDGHEIHVRESRLSDSFWLNVKK